MAEQVILYSTTLRTWEVWQESRPLAHGSLMACREAYPDAILPESQIDLAIRNEYPPEEAEKWIRERTRGGGEDA